MNFRDWIKEYFKERPGLAVAAPGVLLLVFASMVNKGIITGLILLGLSLVVYGIIIALRSL